jgi:hypothetical protein
MSERFGKEDGRPGRRFRNVGDAGTVMSVKERLRELEVAFVATGDAEKAAFAWPGVGQVPGDNDKAIFDPALNKVIELAR